MPLNDIDIRLILVIFMLLDVGVWVVLLGTFDWTLRKRTIKCDRHTSACVVETSLTASWVLS